MAGATTLLKSYLSNIALLTESADTYIIPNGETWEILRWWGSANPSKDCHVALVWDYDGGGEEIVALTHDGEKRDVKREFIGDGSKKLAVVLVNDSLDAERLGGGFEYKVL